MTLGSYSTFPCLRSPGVTWGGGTCSIGLRWEVAFAKERLTTLPSSLVLQGRESWLQDPLSVGGTPTAYTQVLLTH